MQQFNIELDAPSTPLVLYAMQADSLSRFFQMTITQGGTAWTPPDGAIWTVRFGAPNMPAGWYDTITEVGGSTHPAVVASDNVAVVEIAEQAVSMAGQNILCVLVTDATGYQIASWQFQLLVTAVPGYDAPEATTYYNALTEQVAQTLANAQAAAASAVLSQSWAVGNTGTRDGENTNNAQYWSQQAAQSAQEAVGFRTMQGGAVLPIDGDVDLTQPYPTETGGSLTVTSAANRIDSVTINGFTTQTGIGDPGPDNVRPILNAGEFNKILVLNGTETISLYTDPSTEVKTYIFQNVAPDWPPTKTYDAICTSYPFKDTATNSFAIRGPITDNGSVVIRDDSVSSVDQLKLKLTANNATIAYKSTEDTGEHYTGIAVKRDGTYRCEIIRLADRLHAGDTLETNVQSEYDAYAEFDGSSDENWILESGGATGSSGSKWFSLKFTGPQIKNITTTEVPEAASNFLIADTSQNTYLAKSDNTFSLAYSSGNILQVRVAGIATVESLKTHLQSHPLRVFYKSASTGAPKSIRREEYTRRSRVLTGTEAMTATTVSEKTYFAIPAPDAKRPSNTTDVLNTKSNMLATSSQSNIILSDYRVCVSTGGNFLIYFNIDVKTVEQAKQILLEKYNAGTPGVIEYDLATPEVYADTPIIVNNPQGTYTVSGESGTTCQVFMEPLQNGGDADTLNGNTIEDILSDAPVQSVNGQTGAVQLTAADVGALTQPTFSTNPVDIKAYNKSSNAYTTPSAGWLTIGSSVDSTVAILCTNYPYPGGYLATVTGTSTAGGIATVFVPAGASVYCNALSGTIDNFQFVAAEQ